MSTRSFFRAQNISSGDLFLLHFHLDIYRYICIPTKYSMPRTTLSREAYAEIRSGQLSVRAAKQKYHISQERYNRIRHSSEKNLPNAENLQPVEENVSQLEDMWRNLVDRYPHLFISDTEKQILEQSGYTFYERYKIPKQFLELYLLSMQY